MAVVLLSFICIAGCGRDYPTESQASFLVVHGMVAAAESRQEIIVEQAREIGAGYYKGLTPASGVEVTVSGDRVYAFDEDPARPGVYTAMFRPRSGERYSLRITGPAGEVIMGETVIPGAPELISPGADTVIFWGNYVDLSWSSVPTAAGYVIIDAPPEQPASIPAILHPTLVSDTTIQIQPGKFGGTAFHIRVAAVDSNYVRYEQGVSDSDDRSRVRSTVDGGYGLFGSYGLSDARLIAVQ